MLAVRFDIVIPSVGPSFPPTTTYPDVNENISEITISVVFSVTCNIFFGTQKKTHESASEQKPTSDIFGNNNNNNNDNIGGGDEVQYLVQYFIQPYFIATKLPKPEKTQIGKYRFPEVQQQQHPETSGFHQNFGLSQIRSGTSGFHQFSGTENSGFPHISATENFVFPQISGPNISGIENSGYSETLNFNNQKPVSFLVQVAKAEGVSTILPTKSVLPFLGQFSNLLHLALKTPPPPELLPVSKIGIKGEPLPQPAVPIPEESPTSLLNPSEPEFVLNVRKILSEDSPRHVELCEDGVGGTYFIRDQRTPLAVFKPSDEEPGASLNPKKKLDKPLLPPGGGARREYAAYVLDDSHAGVPETYLVEKISHRKMSNGGSLPIPKSGSLQRFVANKGDSSSMSPSRFSVEDVHAVAILDLRILNLDRNGENLLVCTTDDSNGDHGVRLVPIDHTYVLPPTVDYDPYFEWHYWRQTKEPISAASRTYIENLDPERDAQRLRTAGIDEGSIRTMKIATLLLQKGTAAGLTLFDMANMVCRGRNKKSELSEIVANAENAPAEFWSELTLLIEQAVRSKKRT